MGKANGTLTVAGLGSHSAGLLVGRGGDSLEQFVRKRRGSRGVEAGRRKEPTAGNTETSARELRSSSS